MLLCHQNLQISSLAATCKVEPEQQHGWTVWLMYISHDVVLVSFVRLIAACIRCQPGDSSPELRIFDKGKKQVESLYRYQRIRKRRM